MIMRTRIILAVILLVAALGIVAWWFLRAPSPPTPQRVSFADLPGWGTGDPSPALAAFERSCAKPVPVFAAACRDAASVPDAAAARAFFERHFVPYAIGDGLVTGYYEPLLHGSITPHGAYQTPVYALPDDLVTIDLGRFKPELQGQRVTGQVDGHHVVPYPNRAAIDAHPPRARVLFYADDPVAVFFLHIQGSGRVLLDDGRMLRVTYAGQNGRPYTAVGRTLIAQGALKREDVSLQSIRAWLKAHPGKMRAVLETDASYVFFKDEAVADRALGPEGTQGVALTPNGSAAVDAQAHPFGTPLYVAGHGLVVAQDTGGAIKGAARADLFFGFGARAEDAAGTLKDHAAFFELRPK
jgi:membrane-bound lytic murein transglycosylase A